LLFFRLRFARTRDVAWEEAYYFWTKVFALTFALGVVSGIVMSFPVRHQLAGFHGAHGQYFWAAAGL
jgi:cytochrome bd ubiquinol oxidase subunit I